MERVHDNEVSVQASIDGANGIIPVVAKSGVLCDHGGEIIIREVGIEIVRVPHICNLQFVKDIFRTAWTPIWCE